MTPTTTPTLVIDVFPAAPQDLRRRLQDRAMAACLPGGVVLEESASGATYQLDAEGGWTLNQVGGEWHFSHADGHVVVLNHQGATLRPAR